MKQRKRPTQADGPTHLQIATVETEGPPVVRGKRLFDLTTAAVLAIATLPLQALGLVVSGLSFRAMPIFTQERVGLNGETFTFFKIRSLPANTPTQASKHEIATVKNSRAGAFLRKTHFDELLQLWSVIKGDMSLVGPRPEMIGLSAQYDSSFVERRTQVRPGVTGLWQISEGSKQLIGETPGYDLYYLAHRSWQLEKWILLRTVSKMIRGEMVTYADLDAQKVGELDGYEAMDEPMARLPA